MYKKSDAWHFINNMHGRSASDICRLAWTELRRTVGGPPEVRGASQKKFEITEY